MDGWANMFSQIPSLLPLEPIARATCFSFGELMGNSEHLSDEMSHVQPHTTHLVRVMHLTLYHTNLSLYVVGFKSVSLSAGESHTSDGHTSSLVSVELIGLLSQ